MDKPERKETAQRALVYVAIAVAVVILLVLLWYAIDVVLLAFIGILLAIPVARAGRLVERPQRAKRGLGASRWSVSSWSPFWLSARFSLAVASRRRRCSS